MIYLEDMSEQGKKCRVVIKGESIDCVVVCSFEITQKNGSKNVKYRVESKDHTIYDNINPSDIIFNKD
jgi:hypothetical protein